MSFVTVEKPRPYITQITLNRPDSYNAVNEQLSADLLSALAQATNDAVGE